MNKTRAELLAPAGAFETLKAVAAAGADAVYGAGKQFGARAYASNFTDEELLKAIDYLHLHGKRLYLTVNTLLKEEELKRELFSYVEPLYRQGLDGVIIQDLGVLAFLREHFPGMQLHASTQMNITGPYGAALLKEAGCSRIVTAREISLKEIQAIHHKVDIEIEAFIHGALCYCYSGQCLLSSMLGGRSGNRGRCAQPCRLPYRTGNRQAHLLSPKDMCTIELLPQIIESGVYSLKIEGRMKQAEYAAGVTAIYREYLDRCLMHPGEEYQVSPDDMRRLMELGSRSGFTKGYYLMQNGPQMMAMEKPSHAKSNEDLQTEVRKKYIQGEIQEKMNGILTLSKESPASLVLNYKGVEVEVTGDTVQKAQSRPMDKENILGKMKKTGGTAFAFDSLELRMEEDIFFPIGALNRLRREGILALEEKLLSEYRREAPGTTDTVSQTGCHATEGNRSRKLRHPSHGEDSSRYLAVGVQTIEQCGQVLQYSYVNRIYLDSGALDQGRELKQLQPLLTETRAAGKELYYVLPPVLRGDTIARCEKELPSLAQTGLDGFVTGSYEGLGLLQELRKSFPGIKLLADSSLYAWNARAAKELYRSGADEITLPVEANRRELLNRRYEGGELLLYGYLPLMVSAQCLVKNTRGCTGETGFTELTDRYGKIFFVKSQCRDCINILYNAAPLSLLHQQEAVKELEAGGLRIFFTRESNKQIARVMSFYERGFLREEPLDKEGYLEEYTNGHFKRGAE